MLCITSFLKCYT